MKIVLAAIFLLLTLALTGSASAASPICPQGSYSDGCAGANPSALIQFPSWFTTRAPQSGQRFAHRPPFNVAAVDYPVGITTPLASLKDPTKGGLPSVCTYYPHGIGPYTFGPEVFCNASGGVTSLNLSGWDFGVTSTHGCIFVDIGGDLTGNVDIHNNHFESDKNCNAAAAKIYYMSLLYFQQKARSNATVYNNLFEGHWTDPCCDVSPGGGVSGATYWGSGQFSFTYNASFGTSAHHLMYLASWANPGGSHFFVGYNYMEGWGHRSPTAHGEATFAAGFMDWQDYEYNTILETVDSCSCSTTAIYPAAVDGGAVGYAILNGNTIVGGNLVGGATNTDNFFSGTIDDGAGVGDGGKPGNILTVRTISRGAPAVGESYAGGPVQISSHVPGSPASGVGSQWYVDCSGASRWCNGVSFTPSIAATFGSVDWVAIYAYWQGASFNHGSITGGNSNISGTPSITITNNYVDWTRTNHSTGVWTQNGKNFACAYPTFFSGNVDLVTGDALNAYKVKNGSGC